MKILPILIAGFVLCICGEIAAQEIAGPDALPAPAFIEPANPDGSRCFAVWNKAPYTITGTVNTNYYDTAAGTKARGNRNFRLAPGEKEDICSFGPFYPGERLELVLRSLIPLFSCYTVAQGDVIIYGEIKPEGGTRTWADCQ